MKINISHVLYICKYKNMYINIISNAHSHLTFPLIKCPLYKMNDLELYIQHILSYVPLLRYVNACADIFTLKTFKSWPRSDPVSELCIAFV